MVARIGWWWGEQKWCRWGIGSGNPQFKRHVAPDHKFLYFAMSRWIAHTPEYDLRSPEPLGHQVATVIEETAATVEFDG